MESTSINNKLPCLVRAQWKLNDESLCTLLWTCLPDKSRLRSRARTGLVQLGLRSWHRRLTFLRRQIDWLVWRCSSRWLSSSGTFRIRRLRRRTWCRRLEQSVRRWGRISGLGKAVRGLAGSQHGQNGRIESSDGIHLQIDKFSFLI